MIIRLDDLRIYFIECIQSNTTYVEVLQSLCLNHVLFRSCIVRFEEIEQPSDQFLFICYFCIDLLHIVSLNTRSIEISKSLLFLLLSHIHIT